MTPDNPKTLASDHHRVEVVLDDVICELYRDIAHWDVEIRDLTPYGSAVMQRSVHLLIDEHVERLRDQLLHLPLRTEP